jgi:23S rRNA (uracil1939-C5)-methyltransferase
MNASDSEDLIVEIEKCVHGGDGLARHEGKTYFVEGGVPGDIVSLCSVKQKKRSFFAEIKEVIRSSSDRREPPCIHYKDCGGCDWQQMTHEAQLKSKMSIFKDTLRFIGGIDHPIQIESVSGKEWKYRHRAQFKVEGDAVGFYARKSHRVVEINACQVLTDDINDSLNSIKENAPDNVSQIKIFSSLNGKLATEPLLSQISTKKVETEINGVRVMVSGGGFFQQNRELTPQLGAWVAESLMGDYGIDLYGGSGFFSWMIHDRVKEVLLVEKEPELIHLAEETTKLNNIKNVKTHCMTAEKFFSSQHFKKIREDATLILDPPRGGLHKKILPQLAKLKCARIIYVSCDPATQARDIKSLCSAGKFEIKKAALFDLYPNTHHMESVIILDHHQKS